MKRIRRAASTLIVACGLFKAIVLPTAFEFVLRTSCFSAAISIEARSVFDDFVPVRVLSNFFNVTRALL